MKPWTWLHSMGPFSGRVLSSYALASTGLGIGCGLLLFPNEASLIGVVLVAFSQARVVEGLLDRNRDEIWGGDVKPGVANRKLAMALLTLFMGVFAAYVAAVQLAPVDSMEHWFDRQLGNFVGGSMLDIHFGTFTELLSRNGLVLVGCFAFALIYRHGGMLLVLAWNASRWGVIFSYIARVASMNPDVDTAGYLGRTMVSILPHLVLEAIAYILVAMSGVFLSKAITKYAISSDEFLQVGTAVLKIAGAAVAILVLAAAVEARLAPVLVDTLFVEGAAAP